MSTISRKHATYRRMIRAHFLKSSQWNGCTFVTYPFFRLFMCSTIFKGKHHYSSNHQSTKLNGFKSIEHGGHCNSVPVQHEYFKALLSKYSCYYCYQNIPLKAENFCSPRGLEQSCVDENVTNDSTKIFAVATKLCRI